MSNSRDKKFMRRAIEIAEASQREGNLPVGAVITLEGEVVGEGNSAVVEPQYNPGRHAEIVALRDVDDRLWPRAAEMTCYTTLEPCVMCAGTLLLHGVGRVVFGAVDRLGGAGCILDHLPPYYDEGGVYDWEGPLMPEECDPLYERADELFAQLPVGRDGWSSGDDEPGRGDGTSPLGRLEEFRGGGVGLPAARRALDELVERREGDELAELLPFARAIFNEGGYLKDYRRLRRLAKRSGAPDPFDDVEATVREQLPDIWIKKALERGQIDQAADCWFDREGHRRLRLCADELVEACGTDRVQLVISCRLAVVEYLVGRRTRRHYRRACGELRRLRDELRRAGHADFWPVVLDDLRERYDNLPALLDEMRKAGFGQ